MQRNQPSSQEMAREQTLLYQVIHGILNDLAGAGAAEEECYRLALIGCEIGGNIEALLYPIIGHIRITALLQHVDRPSGTVLELAAERIKALFGRLIRIGVPPVGHSDFSIVCRNCETLPDAIIATCIAT